MSERNEFIDGLLRDRGCYRYLKSSLIEDGMEADIAEKQLCNDPEEYEDALIGALDAGLSADEIADILLGATS